MLTKIEQHGDIQILRLNTKRLSSDAGRFLSDTGMQTRLLPDQVALIDLSSVMRLDYSGVALLLTLHQGPRAVGFFGLRDTVRARLAETGFDKVLRVFDDKPRALASPWARRYRLAGRQAVLLSAGKGTRAAPLTRDVPKPMLDILGKPVLERLMDFMAGFGMRDFMLNPGHLGPQIHTHFGDGHRFGYRVRYMNEGTYGPEGWSARPIGSASALSRLANQHAAFERDTIVLCGDALIDLDLAEMMDHHISSGAMATIAAQTVAPELVSKYGIIVTDDDGQMTSFQEKPAREQARSRLANTGIYIFSPEALRLLPDRAEMDIATDLLPAIQRAGGRIQAYSPGFSWTDIGCACDYFAAVSAALQGDIELADPGNLSAGGVIVGIGAQVSPRAKLAGPVYVGAGAKIMPGAQITGPAVIGRDAVVEARTVLRNSILMPDTRLRRGGMLVDMIASGHWAVSHPLADGRTLPVPPADLVEPVTPALAMAAPSGRTAFLQAAG